MKKTTSINKSKLAGYTAVAGAIVAGGAANAQITYMDINPDMVVDCVAFFNKATFVTAESVRQTHGFFCQT